MPPVVLALRGVEKRYGALRPLRIRELTVHEGESVALVGVDGPAAEVLVDLITGSVVPDDGEVHVFGAPTSSVPDGGAWLALLDRFGMLSPRAVLLGAMTAAQNLALPFSLAIDPIPADVMAHVTRLAGEVGLEAGDLQTPAAALPALTQARIRLARALALGPSLLVAEHPNALVEPGAVTGLAEMLAGVVRGRALSSLVLTADSRFAGAVAPRVLTLDPATGAVREAGGWSSWFRRG
jgi:ABC-type transporter Mla maintaining outer membrane lipid asymmetry ATPase subunit MlaF